MSHVGLDSVPDPYQEWESLSPVCSDPDLRTVTRLPVDLTYQAGYPNCCRLASRKK